MLPPMTTPTNPRLDELLSTRARIGWGASLPPARPVAEALFEFGGGHPDPSSFPYEGMVEATADVMKAEGAAALSYGEPQGDKGRGESRGGGEEGGGRRGACGGRAGGLQGAARVGRPQVPPLREPRGPDGQ